MITGFGIFFLVTPSSAATPPTLTLGAPQFFSYTNDTHIASYAINFTKDNLYKITLTNKKGCNILADLYWPDYLYECDGCGIGIPRMNGTSLLPYPPYYFDMGVWFITDWNATSEDFFYFAIRDFNLLINCYSTPTDRNGSIAWEDLGGSITVSEVTSTHVDETSAMTWSTSFATSEDFKYKKLNITSTGLYQFVLNSTVNDTEIFIYEPDITGLNLVMRHTALGDDNSSDDAYTWQYYLSQGTYYLHASPYYTEGCSFNLYIKEVLLPVVSPPTVDSTNVKLYHSNMSSPPFMNFAIQGINVSGLESRVLYDWSVSCPNGFDVWAFFPFMQSYFHNMRTENKSESGAMIFIPPKDPRECKFNGEVIPNMKTLMLGGYDEDIGDSLERYYDLNEYISKSCEFDISNDAIDLIIYVLIFNTSVPFTDTSLTFSFKESSKQPVDLPTTKTYSFSSISDSDDEGIYKLPVNTTNTVVGFLMDSMGDNATTTLTLETPTGGGIIPEWFLWLSKSKTFKNSTYETYNLDKYITEWAIFEETWVLLADDSFPGSGYPTQNSTSFTMSYDWNEPISIGTEYDRNRGEDLTLLNGTLDCCCYINIEAISGKANVYSPWAYESNVRSIDGKCFGTTAFSGGNYGVVYTCKESEYYIVLDSNTDDGYHNIGTFKATVTYEAPVEAPIIPGYPIFIILTFSFVAIAVVALKFYKKRESK